MVEITRDRTLQLFMSKIDLDYAYGQLKLSEETSRQCVSQSPERNSAGTPDLKIGFTDSPMSPQFSRRK